MNLVNHVNPLPGVPSIESPFFSELFDKADPRYGIASALRENGFAVIDFPEPDLDQITCRIQKDLHDKYDWAGWNAGLNTDMRVMDAWK